MLGPYAAATTDDARTARDPVTREGEVAVRVEVGADLVQLRVRLGARVERSGGVRIDTDARSAGPARGTGCAGSAGCLLTEHRRSLAHRRTHHFRLAAVEEDRLSIER